jgi:membrane-bound inhibitor of C-type lysozyme
MNRFNTIALILLVIVIALVLTHGHAPEVPTATSTIAYSCNGGKGVIAQYYAGDTVATSTPGAAPTSTGKVIVSLSDGRTLTLAHTISADGVRYANADDSFVFWGKGNGALVLENNQQKSYIGCIAVAPAPADANLSRVYSNSAGGFSIRLPSDYGIDESYYYQELGPTKKIPGVKFTVSTSTTSGTNLAPDTYVSLEEIPQTTGCSAALFLDQVKAYALTEGNTLYSVATSTGAAAGNRYDELVYAIPGTNPCIGIRYFIHSGVFENYPAGTVTQFDPQKLLGTFDAIRRTLVIVQ